MPFATTTSSRKLFAILLITGAYQISSFLVLQRHCTTSLYSTKQKSHDAPYTEASYDPYAASTYYQKRNAQSLSRLLQILSKSSVFVASTVLDSALNREEEMAERRSAELLNLISDLGPTFIKVS